MNNIQNEVGRKAEIEIAQFFKNKNYWAFIIPKSIAGQPFDIIARRKNDVWFVDAKHLESNKVSFAFDRIEPNQITSMSYARTIAQINKNMGFVIRWEKCPETFFYLSFDKYLDLSQNNVKSIKMSELLDLEKELENEYNN